MPGLTGRQHPRPKPARNLPRSREELILALDLYVRAGLLDDTHPDVVALSRTLNGTVKLSGRERSWRGMEGWKGVKRVC